jgi:hypothetical protein
VLVEIEVAVQETAAYGRSATGKEFWNEDLAV